MRATRLVACTLLVLAAATLAASAAEPAGLKEAKDKVFAKFKETDNPYARAEAILNMGDFDDPLFVDFLVDILSRTTNSRANFIIQHTIAQRLGKLKNEAAVQRIVESVERMKKVRRASVTAVLVRGLGMNKSEVAAKAILEGLKDQNMNVKAEAVRHADKLKDPEAVGLLIEMLSSRYKQQRMPAYNALVTLTGCKLPVDKKKWDAWWEANKEKVTELPVPEALRVEEEITKWPMVEDRSFQCRTPAGRAQALRAYAPPAFRGRVVASVEAGLQWLADHQSEEGYWDVDEFWAGDPKYKSKGLTLEELKKEKEMKEPPLWDPDKPRPGIGTIGEGMDLPATGLSLMAFCGHGYTHRHGKHKATVQKALKWLVSKQNEKTGAFTNNMYIHAICAHAVIELWGLTRDAELRAPAQKATDFLCYAQNEGSGWRYGPKSGSSDSSVSSWCSMALQTARRSDLDVPAENLIWCRNFWDKVTVYSKQEGDKEFGQAFYALNADGTHTGSGSYANTAASILCRIFMGTMHRARSVQAGAFYLEDASATELVPNIYMWIYTTQAFFQMGGRQWSEWEKQVMPEVANLQAGWGRGAKTGDEGSFWCDTRWISKPMGRIGVTAACCLILETYYFYPKIKNE